MDRSGRTVQGASAAQPLAASSSATCAASTARHPPTQLQGHMGTHSNNQANPSPITPNVAASSSVSLSNMVPATNVYVAGNTVVDLLVTDCSSISAPQPHS
ncbi:hypothetical protein L3Q82_001171 [Scortum barcoo]|uniref:Uncharacterized protein n=1 Tax=Scortum barcoo TaxID=214431 RepID=A0ACB8WBM9_9TELE|nr:hypothetical protein L3Q82_001171 [Scortum barcoo]